MVTDEMVLFCKMEKKTTKHMSLGEDMNISVRWKCMNCGEYNQPGVEKEDCPLCGGSGKIVNQFGEDDIEYEACPCGGGIRTVWRR